MTFLTDFTRFFNTAFKESSFSLFMKTIKIYLKKKSDDLTPRPCPRELISPDIQKEAFQKTRYKFKPLRELN